jgi:transketolase
LLARLQSGTLPDGIDDILPTFDAGTSLATRAASGKVLNALAGVMPELWGGSSDLAESNLTTIDGANSFVPAEHSTAHWTGDPYGRVLHFGIREHAMGAILNGIALHGPTRAYGGTFLIFSDYMRPAVRLAALMKTPSIFVWSHDSVALGEDGPTHQPIEQLATLRAIPGLDVVRPADANETAWAWKAILARRNGPAGIALSRQNLPIFERGTAASATDFAPARNAEKGAYTLIDSPTGTIDVILIATGSEVSLAVEARTLLEAKGIGARVVSAPCLEWFDEQPEKYRESVLPSSVTARVSVEAGLALGWSRYVGATGVSVSIEHFGASADYQTLFREFGMTASAVADAAASQVSYSKGSLRDQPHTTTIRSRRIHLARRSFTRPHRIRFAGIPHRQSQCCRCHHQPDHFRLGAGYGQELRAADGAASRSGRLRHRRRFRGDLRRRR